MPTYALASIPEQSSCGAAPASRKVGDGIAHQTETALHRTRLHDLDLKNFAKEFLCKRTASSRRRRACRV